MARFTGFLVMGLIGLFAVAACAPAAPPAPTTAPATTAPTAAPAAPKPSAPAAAASPSAAVAASPAASPAVSPAASPVAKPAASPAASAVPSPSPAAAPLPTGPNGEKLIEQSSEVRFQLDLQVPDAAMAAFMPSGWSPNVATTGAAKDANLRAVFIDRVTINGPTGQPLGAGTNRLVYLVAPVRDASGTAVQLVIGGLTADPADAPGAFGNYLLATTHSMKRSTSIGEGSTIMDTQDWEFEAASGEHLELHVTYERGNAARAPVSDTRFYSAKSPGFYQLSRQEQVLDILRNVTTTPPDRVHDFSFVARGGSYAPLFNGTEKVLSWDNILWINRAVFQP